MGGLTKEGGMAMASEKMEVAGLEHLKKNPVFRNLDPAEMEKVVGLFERRSYRAGDSVLTQDEEAKTLFIVERGLVGITMRATHTSEVTVATESSGGAFGWSALVHPQRYTASAKCFQDSELFALDGAKLRELCYREPRLGVKIMEGLACLVAMRLDSARVQLLDMWR